MQRLIPHRPWQGSDAGRAHLQQAPTPSAAALACPGGSSAQLGDRVGHSGTGAAAQGLPGSGAAGEEQLRQLLTGLDQKWMNHPGYRGRAMEAVCKAGVGIRKSNMAENAQVPHGDGLSPLRLYSPTKWPLLC